MIMDRKKLEDNINTMFLKHTKHDICDDLETVLGRPFTRPPLDADGCEMDSTIDVEIAEWNAITDDEMQRLHDFLAARAKKVGWWYPGRE